MAEGDANAQPTTAEQARLEEARDRGIAWKQWGPYLSERQWGTVREDYSENGDAWDYFTHDQARSRAYHWGEDGIAGLSDDRQRLCFALALWNGKDPILKERMFGLTNREGNHGEDVKEYYFYLDSTPTHSYMKFLYKYPQEAYPYGDLVDTNRRRGRRDMEYELLDTGIFDGDRYFDVFVEYAKQGPTDILIQISVSNRGPDAGHASSPAVAVVPQHLELVAGLAKAVAESRDRDATATASSPRPTPSSGPTTCIAKAGRRCSSPRTRRTTSASSARPMPPPTSRTASTTSSRQGRQDAVNPQQTGTKAAAHYQVTVARRANRRRPACA